MKKLDLFQPRCKHRHTAATHPHCFRDGKPVELEAMFTAKTLVLDVETLPLLGYSFNPWNTNITPGHLVKDFCILSFAAKWLDSNSIISDILTPKEAVSRKDKRILETVWKLIEEADVIITHNGKRFDMKKLNARFWKNKIHRPSSYKMIDTLAAAKTSLGLTYNSADFIAKYIGLQDKLDTDLSLWVACDNGNPESLQYMREYNEQDIRMQEEIYMEIREWVPNHPNMAIFARLDNVCPVCLGTDHKEIGLYTADVNQFPEHRCNSCGSVWHDSKAIKKEKE